MIKEILATYLFTKLIGRKRTEKLGIRIQKYTIHIAVVVLGIIAIAGSIQLAFNIRVDVAGWVVPLWLSLIVSIITGYLAFGLWKLK